MAKVKLVSVGGVDESGYIHAIDEFGRMWATENGKKWILLGQPEEDVYDE